MQFFLAFFCAVIAFYGWQSWRRNPLYSLKSTLMDAALLLRTIEDLLSEPNEKRLSRLCGFASNIRYAPAAQPGSPRDSCNRTTMPFNQERPPVQFKASDAEAFRTEMLMRQNTPFDNSPWHHGGLND